MSRRDFWLGLLVGAVITGLLVATAMFVVMRVRWPAAPIYGLRGRQFGVNPRGWVYPHMPGRWFGFGAMLCGPVLLLAGAVMLGVLFGRHWHSRRQDEVQSGGQPSPVEKTVEAEHEPPAEAGESETKG
jgi:hypothetical protein